MASVYIPSLNAADVLAMSDRLYTTHRLTRTDDHTIQCHTGGVTYIPLPAGFPINYPGLLSVDMPDHLSRGSTFTAVVRQVTNASGISGSTPPPSRPAARNEAASIGRRQIQWRKVIGAFQLTIPVKDKRTLLPAEERQLSVLRWIGETIPQTSRWHPVFHRYLHKLGGRVETFGGDPGSILGSPTGDGIKGTGGHGQPGQDHEDLLCFTGKIAGLIFDHFGDFEGFLLEHGLGERKFLSRERGVAELAERAWRERILITVCVERYEPYSPTSIVVRQPPVFFHDRNLHS